MEKVLFFLKKILPSSVFLTLRPVYHYLLAFLAALFFGFPSRKLVVIGVTGTKGKTTVVEMLHEIFKEGGAKTASLSSLCFRIGEKEEGNLKKMTMPGRFFIQKFLHDARRAGCRFAILEVTSEGIKQFRHRFIKFDVAVATNVAPEHIEAHGSFEKYLRAKLDLFWRLPKEGLAVINRDDPNWQRFSASTPAHKMFYGRSGIEKNGKVWAIRDLRTTEAGLVFDLDNISFSSPLPGEFNFYNVLASTAVALSQHVPLDKISRAVGKVENIPGRMELVQQKPFTVVVDYAHTPDSLREVYKFLRSTYNLQPTTLNLICVLGSAGGGRDKWKRPELGKIATEFCDEIILTNEDPYDESPEAILSEIASGLSQIPNSKLQTPNTRKILDRREAIREALKSAKPGGVVIITGKGSEKFIMGPKGTKIAWDDRGVVREELKKI